MHSQSCRLDAKSLAILFDRAPGSDTAKRNEASRASYARLDYWPGPRVNGDEAAILLGSLDRQEVSFAWKVDGLDSMGLQATVSASTITLGGPFKPLAHVEDFYFSQRSTIARPPRSDVGDWGHDPDRAWVSAATNEPDYFCDL